MGGSASGERWAAGHARAGYVRELAAGCSAAHATVRAGAIRRGSRSAQNWQLRPSAGGLYVWTAQERVRQCSGATTAAYEGRWDCIQVSG